VIHSDLAEGAAVLNETLKLAPEALPELVVALAIGLELCRRELLMHLWALEE